ncbi:MAG: hypothetical protein ABSG68_20075 [Thermoguttaceae bacterium]|jgi:hypothetical protein
MDRITVLLAVFLSACLPMGTVAADLATAADPTATLGQLVDLSGNMVAEVDGGRLWPWNRDDLTLCDGAVPGPSLLGTIRAGALILTRSRATAQPSSRIFRLGDQAVLLDTADLELGTHAGLDITVLAPLSQANELEFRYFGIDGFDASRTASDPTGVQFVGFGAAVPGSAEQVAYRSRLYNVELNLRPQVAEGIPLILGFRTLQLHERLELWRLDPPPEMGFLGNHTNNYLYGFQVGVEPYFNPAGGQLRLEGLAKAGIYGNHADQGSYSPLAGTTLSACEDRASFVGELGLTIAYRFSQFFSVRVGYELMWLYGVALAPNQGSSTALMSPLSADINSSATAFYQGAAASLEFVF